MASEHPETGLLSNFVPTFQLLLPTKDKIVEFDSILAVLALFLAIRGQNWHEALGSKKVPGF